jgi:hypothetical protein
MSALLRTYATPVSLFSFIGVGLTGMLMFFGVRGGPLGEIHEWVGVVFVVALVLHLARNWRGVLAMLSTTSGKLIGVGLSVVTVALILITLPYGGGQHQNRHGPWLVVNRIADAPIATMAPALGLTGEEAVARLRRGGVEVDGVQESLSKIASDHDEPLPRMLNLLVSERGDDAT